MATRRDCRRRLTWAISWRRCARPLETTARSLEAKVTCRARGFDRAFSLLLPACLRFLLARVFPETSVAFGRREKEDLRLLTGQTFALKYAK